MYCARNPAHHIPAPTITFQRISPIMKFPRVKIFSTGPTLRCRIYGKSGGRDAGIKPRTM
jgi:hypothetical protein